MESLFLIIAGASIALGTALSIVYMRSAKITATYKPTVNPELLRKDMLADANSPEERAYLQEMSELDLHRRHIVC